MSVITEKKNHATPGKAMLASVTGYAMDGFDLLILGFMLPAISIELGLTSSAAGSLVTWTLIGAVLGGVIFGHLSDRFGRIRVLTITILMFSLFTGLCAVAQGYWDLLAYRTLAGIGLGGEFGIGMALIAEAWPAEKRNRASAYVGMGWQLGVLAAAFLTPLLLEHIGWRGMFVLGMAPALVAWLVRKTLHEPVVERTDTSGADALVAQLVRAVRAAGDAAAVGVAVPSVVDWETGRIRSSVNIPLHDVPLREIVAGTPPGGGLDRTARALAAEIPADTFAATKRQLRRESIERIGRYADEDDVVEGLWTLRATDGWTARYLESVTRR